MPAPSHAHRSGCDPATSAIEAALAQLDVEDFSVLPPFPPGLDLRQPKGRVSSSPGHARPVLQRQRAVMSVDELDDDDDDAHPRTRRAFRVYRRSGSADSAMTRRVFRLHPCDAVSVNEASAHADPSATDGQLPPALHRMGRRLRWPY